MLRLAKFWLARGLNHMSMFTDSTQWIQGHVLIRDTNTGEVLVDKPNAINYENFSISLAQTIANRPQSWIQEMCFGNGGAKVSEIGTITYLPPNVTGQTAELYNQTYYKVVDDQSPLDLNTALNYISTAHIDGTTYTDVIVTCTLDLGEPSGQDAFDTATNLNGSYVFNELGLKAYSVNGPNTGRLLTHVIFSPVQKSLNRQIQIVYTIRIQTV
jgi:hypothetical protein